MLVFIYVICVNPNMERIPRITVLNKDRIQHKLELGNIKFIKYICKKYQTLPS